jgi:hypothetical protein
MDTFRRHGGDRVRLIPRGEYNWTATLDRRGPSLVARGSSQITPTLLAFGCPADMLPRPNSVAVMDRAAGRDSARSRRMWVFG